MKFKKISILVMCGLIGWVAVTPGQNKRVGTAAATELLIPVGARDLGRGESTIASSVGVESIFYNPAGLGSMQNSAEGMFSSMQYIADVGISYGAVAVQFAGFGAVALSIKSLDFGDIPLTTEDDSENFNNRSFSPAYITFGVSYARQLTEAISAGGTLKLVSETIDRASASGTAIDIGIQYRGLARIQGLQLGVAVKNIGPGMKFEGPGLLTSADPVDGERPVQKLKIDAGTFELPSIVEIGLAYESQMAENVLGTFSGAFANNNLFTDEYKLGAEVAYTLETVRLFARAGYQMAPQAENSIFGATLGLGLYYNGGGVGIAVDYAYREVEFFDGNSVLAVKVSF